MRAERVRLSQYIWCTQGHQKRLRAQRSWSNNSEIHRKLYRYLNDTHVFPARTIRLLLHVTPTSDKALRLGSA